MLSKARLKALRLTKKLAQGQLPGLTQNQVSNCEQHGTDSIRLLVAFVDALDCTEAFLLGKGFPDLKLDDEVELRKVVSRMAFDVFRERKLTTDTHRQRCMRVLGHKAAPLTADEWTVLAEQIDLAVTPTDGGNSLKAIEGGRAS